VLGHQRIDEALHVGRRRRQSRHRRGHVRDADRPHVVAAERQRAGHQLVEHHAEAVEIGAPADLLAAPLLRAHVARRADERAFARELGAGRERVRDAEVREETRPVGTPQDVLRLDVAMHDAVAMRVVERTGDLAHDPQRGVRVLGDERGGRAGAARLVFHRHVRGARVLADVEDRDDVRMAQVRGDARFAQEAPCRARVLREGRRQHLQRDLARERLLHGEVHQRHSALPSCRRIV
jgi:hypothetical protein